MAENKFISELSGITNPSLTGYTIYDDGNTTYKMALGELTAFVTTAEGDFATTGSNIFNGSQTINGSIIISGSGNIYTKPLNPVTGMTRQMSSYNTFIGNESIPQKSDNMQFSPTVSYNIGAVQGNTINFYGPNTTTSSWNVMSNLFMGGQGINFGTLSNPMNKISGSVQISANIMNNGSLNVKGYDTNLNGPYNIAGNIINGGLLNLNSYSSSLNFNSNNVNALVNVDNFYRPISGTRISSLSPRVNFNMLYGNNHRLIFSGSNSTTGQTKSFNWNLLQGEFITASIGDGDNSNIADTAIIGNSLVVSGSSTMVDGDANYTQNNTHGSAFFGRFNSISGNKAKTAETVFAVGTGTQSSRRTGFLIDSGSNVQIDGTLVIGNGSLHTDNPEILQVKNSGSFNNSHFEGNSNTYLQVNVKNINSGAGASSDFVATADNGTEDLHYVNMGINSSGFDNDFSVGYQNDAYLINRGRDLYIGSLDGPDYNHTHVHLFSSNSWQNPQISIVSDGKIGFNTGSISEGFQYEFSGSVKVVGSQVIQSTNPNPNYVTKIAGYDGGAKLAIGVSSDPNFGISNDILNSSENGYSPFTLTAQSVTINADTAINGIIDIDSVSENIIPYDEPSTGITHNFINGSIVYVSNPSSDFIIDVVGVSTTNNKAIGLTVIIEQGTPAYKITGLQINSEDEGPVSINWFGGSQPTGTTNSTDIFAFSLIKVNNTWRVLGQKTTF